MSYLIIMINNLPKVFCHPKNTRKIIPIFKREAKRGSLVKVKVTQSCLTLCDPHGLYSPWNSPGQNTGVSSLSLLQGIFPTQGSHLSLMSPVLAGGFLTTSTTWEAPWFHFKSEVKVEVPQSRPTLCDPMGIVYGILQARILESVAFPFSRGFSQPRNWTQISCIAGRFFTSWGTREAQEQWSE